MYYISSRIKLLDVYVIFYLSYIRRRVCYLEVYAIILIIIIYYRFIRSIILSYYILGIL